MPQPEPEKNTPPTESWWTRFKAWWNEDDNEDDTEDDCFGETAFQSITEQIKERLAFESANEKANARVSAYNSIVQDTYVQYVIQHPNEPDVHRTAFQIGIKAADEWRAITEPKVDK